jgi:shikimate dehydrogenase
VAGVERLAQLALQIVKDWSGVSPEESVFQKAVSEELRVRNQGSGTH